MAYTTPARYCEEVGFDEARSQLLDEGRVLTVALLRLVLDVVAGGAWPVEVATPERVVAMAAHDRLLRKLGTVSNFMDGYLATSVALPIAVGDAALGTAEECCLALARDELASDSDMSTDLIVARAARWRKWLVDVANKTVQLVSSTGEPTTTVGSGKVITGQAKSGFDWQRFGAV
jgi:phage gp36-like protein